MAEDRTAEIEFENARLAHAAANKGIETEMNMVASFGNAAMRAPALAAAGGIAALLGFFSANASSLKGTAAVDDFNTAIMWFFLSVVACVASPGTAYISQALFIWAKGARTHHFERPFVRDTMKSKWLFGIGVCFQISAIVLTIMAIAALVIGGLAFMDFATFTALGELEPGASPVS